MPLDAMPYQIDLVHREPQAVRTRLTEAISVKGKERTGWKK